LDDRGVAVASYVRRKSLCQKPRGWPRRLTEWEKKFVTRRRGSAMSSRRLPRVALRRQAAQSAKPTEGFQAMAAEMTDFSKKRMEDVLQAWQQLLRARHFGDVVEVQTRYAQRAYDAYMSEMSKLGEMYLGTARSASKPVEDTSRRFS
jgi:hypothetical protein